jgi:hypothetical protein
MVLHQATLAVAHAHGTAALALMSTRRPRDLNEGCASPQLAVR